MRRILASVILVVFGTAASALADKTETSGGHAIVGTGDRTTTYYAPTFTYSLDGAWAYLYVQGQHVTTDGWWSVDEIYMYKNPNTWAGLTSPYSLVRTILPDGSGDNPGYEPQPGVVGNPSYGHPAIFRSGNTFYMTVLKSADAATDFKEIHWGVSNASTKPGFPAGEYWKWNRLLRWTLADTGYKIPTAALTETYINGQKYYFGVTELWTPQQEWGGIGLGAIRVHADGSARGYDTVELLNSSGLWQSTNSDGTFSFVPQIIWPGAVEPQIVVENGTTTIWATGSGLPSSCPDCIGAKRTGWADRFQFRTIDPATLSLGTVQNIWSQFRCMPGPYDESRIYPFFIAGASLLYSATDDNCATDHYGEKIVVTGLQ